MWFQNTMRINNAVAVKVDMLLVFDFFFKERHFKYYFSLYIKN